MTGGSIMKVQKRMKRLTVMLQKVQWINNDGTESVKDDMMVRLG